MIKLDLAGIYTYLKNREPLLFIDEVEVEPGEYSCMKKTMPKSAWFFDCHFPGDPMMPGTLQLEMLFQTGAMAIKLLDGYKDKTTNVARVSEVMFTKHIRPGDTIQVITKVRRFKRGIATIDGEISMGNMTCCKAEFVLVVLDDVPNLGRKT